MYTKNVNVADQTYGNPPTGVDSLAIPLDNDVLVPVADQTTPRANDVISTTGPRPVEVIVGEQAPASPSQFFGQPLGVAPLFLPFPPSKTDPNIQGQNLTAGNPAEFTVAGSDISIQTNQTPATGEDYTVTSVIDPDTGLPPVTPTPAVSGTFSSAQNTGVGNVTLVSPSALAFPSGSGVTISASTVPAYNGLQSVSNVLSLAGTFAAAVASISGTKTTLGSAAPLPAGLSSAKVVSIAGAPYSGVHNISDIVSLAGTFIAAGATTPPSSQIILSSPAPTGLSSGQLINLPGTYNWRPVSNVLNLAGSFVSAADSLINPGVTTTLTALGSLPASLQNGQQVTITAGSGSGIYIGTWTVSNVDLVGGTFDISTPFTGNDSGNWSVYTFQITAALGATTGTWTAYTFDIDVAPGITASGTWSVYTFEISATYAGTASGAWNYQPPSPPPATRFKLFVTPTDLQSFGISLLGRMLVFDNTILTLANRKATRPISYFGNDYVIIDKEEPDDPIMPTLATPQAGDTFFLYVQRQGSEAISKIGGATVDVNISASTPPIQGAKNVYL